MISIARLPGGRILYVARASGMVYLRRHDTREQAQAAIDRYVATGEKPPPRPRPGRPSKSGGEPVPLVRRKVLRGSGAVRYEAHVRFPKRKWLYLSTHATEAAAYAACAEYIRTRVMPPKPPRIAPIVKGRAQKPAPEPRAVRSVVGSEDRLAMIRRAAQNVYRACY